MLYPVFPMALFALTAQPPTAQAHSEAKPTAWRREVEFPAVVTGPLPAKKWKEPFIFNGGNGAETILSWKASETLGLGSDDGTVFAAKPNQALKIETRRVNVETYITLQFVKGFPAEQRTGVEEDAPEIEFIAITSPKGFVITGTDSAGHASTHRVTTVLVEKKCGFASQHSIIGRIWMGAARSGLAMRRNGSSVLLFDSEVVPLYKTAAQKKKQAQTHK